MAECNACREAGIMNAMTTVHVREFRQTETEAPPNSELARLCSEAQHLVERDFVANTLSADKIMDDYTHNHDPADSEIVMQTWLRIGLVYRRLKQHLNP
jgi:hypothetical protein